MKFFILFIFLLAEMNSIAYSRKVILIQGNYHGGKGYSIIFKKKLIECIKNKLIKSLSGNYHVKAMIKNMLIPEIFNEEANKIYKEDFQIETLDSEQSIINHEEFNIFISLDKGKTMRLVATSDPHAVLYYYEYLQTGVGRSKRELAINSIVGAIKNIIDSLK
jgi:hypothetical protein